jgi:hypothetical protein
MFTAVIVIMAATWNSNQTAALTCSAVRHAVVGGN